MSELKYKSIVILSPPFHSHFMPLLALGKALSQMGTDVTIGVAPEFRTEVESAGLLFTPVRINRNANTGVAAGTQLAAEEELRLHEFLDATKGGAVETLITQIRHRRADMLADPELLADRIRAIEEQERPSLWIVDQLSYGATLALHGLGLPFVTFCAPHPASIPAGDILYSVPPRWPEAISPLPAEQARLRDAARAGDLSFTRRFNEILLNRFAVGPVSSAFSLHSPLMVLYNYPSFPGRFADAPGHLHFGHSFQKQALPPEWNKVRGRHRKILVAFGTFLSSRADVLRRIVEGIRELESDTTVIVAAGNSLDDLRDLVGEKVLIDRFIPQRAILAHVDLVIHHGGVSSFTESLYEGVPMVVMPFSSDQFNVAFDVQSHGLGAVLNPNTFTTSELGKGIRQAQSEETTRSLLRWAVRIRNRGPQYAAHIVQGGEYV